MSDRAPETRNDPQPLGPRVVRIRNRQPAPSLRLALPRLQLARPRRWPFGSLTFYRTAERHRPGVQLNRYPGEIIGVGLRWRWRCLSWVWPVWLMKRSDGR